MIEIEDVLEATIASGLRKERKRGEDLALDLFVFGGGLDHQIAVAELIEGPGHLNAIEDRLTLRVVDLPFGHLARQMAVDGRQGGVDALLGDVRQRDGHACLGGHLGDAGAHLAGADHANRLDVECHCFVQQTACAAAQS